MFGFMRFGKILVYYFKSKRKWFYRVIYDFRDFDVL